MINKFSQKVVMTVLIINIVFTAFVLAIYWHVGSEPTTLIVSWFAFTTGELWALASIKNEETRRGGTNDHKQV